MRGDDASCVAVFALLVLWPGVAAAQSDLERARALYNAGQYDDSIAAAAAAMLKPAAVPSATLIAARARLERFRQKKDPQDLAAARADLVSLNPRHLAPQEVDRVADRSWHGALPRRSARSRFRDVHERHSLGTGAFVVDGIREAARVVGRHAVSRGRSADRVCAEGRLCGDAGGRDATSSIAIPCHLLRRTGRWWRDAERAIWTAPGMPPSQGGCAWGLTRRGRTSARISTDSSCRP